MASTEATAAGEGELSSPYKPKTKLEDVAISSGLGVGVPAFAVGFGEAVGVFVVGAGVAVGADVGVFVGAEVGA